MIIIPTLVIKRAALAPRIILCRKLIHEITELTLISQLPPQFTHFLYRMYVNN